MKPSEQEGDNEEEAEDEATVCPITQFEPEDGEEVYQLPGQQCTTPSVYNIPALYGWLRSRELQGLKLTDPISRRVIPPEEWEMIKAWMRQHRSGSVPAAPAAPAAAADDDDDDDMQEFIDLVEAEHANNASIDVPDRPFVLTMQGSMDAENGVFQMGLDIEHELAPLLCQIFLQPFLTAPYNPAVTYEETFAAPVRGAAIVPGAAAMGVQRFEWDDLEGLVRQRARLLVTRADFVANLQRMLGPLTDDDDDSVFPQIYLQSFRARGKTYATFNVAWRDISRQTYNTLRRGFRLASNDADAVPRLSGALRGAVETFLEMANALLDHGWETPSDRSAMENTPHVLGFRQAEVLREEETTRGGGAEGPSRHSFIAEYVPSLR